MNEARMYVRRVGLLALAAFVAVVVLAWVAWERSPERRAERLDAQIAAADAAVRRESADRLRELAECNADAVEFGADSSMRIACVEAFKVTDAVRRRSLEQLRARVQALRAERTSRH